VLVAGALVASQLAPDLAVAQGGAGNALTPGLPQPQATIPTTTTPPAATPSVPLTSTTSGGTSSGLTGTDAVLIAIGAMVVLGGIAYFIWYDARRSAPKRGRLVGAGVGSPGRRAGSKPPPKSRKVSPAERRRRKRGRAR
jgi:hypothetical protein